jgi:hypothetical protein
MRLPWRQGSPGLKKKTFYLTMAYASLGFMHALQEDNVKIASKPIMLAIVSLLVATTAPLVAKIRLVDSRFTDKPPLLDGKTTDWDSALIQKEDACEVNFAFQNTARNLYVVFTFASPKTITTFAKTGIVLWLDSKNDKNTDFGLRFRKMKLTPDQFIVLWEKQNGPLADDKKAQLRTQPFYIVDRIDRIEKGKEQTLPLQAPTEATPQYQIDATTGLPSLEFRIPFSQIAGFTLPVSGHLGVGFEWGGLTAKSQGSLYDMQERSETYERDNLDTENLTEYHDTDGYSAGRTRDHFRRPPAKYSFWVEVNLGKQS